jgi:hypothetical protein
MQGRIQCHKNLFVKHIVDSPLCEVCNNKKESADHIIFHCDQGLDVILQLLSGLLLGFNGQLTKLLGTYTVLCCQVPFLRNALALCCWQLWKRRNGIIFRNEAQSLRQFVTACRNEAQLWRLRMPVASRHVVNQWCNVLTS